MNRVGFEYTFRQGNRHFHLRKHRQARIFPHPGHAYVVEKSLDGLFYTVAEEEKKIRRDRQRV